MDNLPIKNKHKYGEFIFKLTFKFINIFLAWIFMPFIFIASFNVPDIFTSHQKGFLLSGWSGLIYQVVFISVPVILFILSTSVKKLYWLYTLFTILFVAYHLIF